MREFTITVNLYQLQTLHEALTHRVHAAQELLGPVTQMLQAATQGLPASTPSPSGADGQPPAADVATASTEPPAAP